MDKLNKQELRRLAEAMPGLDWDSNFENNEQTGFCCVYAKPFEIDGEMYDGQTFVELCHPEQAKFIAEAKENILSLLDELEQCSKDAERYRWLRDKHNEEKGDTWVSVWSGEWKSLDSHLLPGFDGELDLDKSVDAAIAKEGGANG